MFSLDSQRRYYLYAPACDMRKSFDSLSGLVRQHLGCDPEDGSVYIFLNRRRTHLKLLHWASGGWVLYYKRLAQGQFLLPTRVQDSGLITWPELVLMGAGMQVQTLRQSPRYALKK